MTTPHRGAFASRIGVILAAAGSAVGLGNIWRFPTEAGSNGGGAFILLYIACIILFGLPIMLSEFIIGRQATTNSATAYKRLAPGTAWHLVGKLTVLTPFLILCYYNVVAGWTLDYTVQALGNSFSAMAESGNPNAFADYFSGFISNPYLPVVYLSLFMLFTHTIVVRGVNAGIERFSKILMPALFIILIVLLICAMQMPGAGKAIDFIFNPDFDKITTGVVLAAMGQAFYSLSVGMGAMTTYASYFKPDTHLSKSALSIGGIDLFVSVMAGLVIFPAVFSMPNLSPDAGASLIFIALPNVFHSAFQGMPLLGYFFSVAFYALLVFATVTSTISLHEAVTAYLHEAFGLTRRRAATIVSLSAIGIGSLCALSLGPLKTYTVAGLPLFDLFDYVTAKWLLPIGGLLSSVFAGWYLSRHVVKSQMTNGGTMRFRLFGIFLFFLRFLCPIGIVLVFLNELGVFKLPQLL